MLSHCLGFIYNTEKYNTEKYNTKDNPNPDPNPNPNPNHCSSSFLLPVIK